MAVKKIASLYRSVLEDLKETVYDLAAGLNNAYAADLDDLEMDIEIASSFLEKLYRELEKFSSENHGSTLLRAIVSILVAVFDTLVMLLEKMEESKEFMKRTKHY